MRKTILVLAIGLVVGTGCSDPYSQRRIARRTAHLNETVEGLLDREGESERRTHEDLKTLRRWWERDCEDWERRAPTVGDYIW